MGCLESTLANAGCPVRFEKVSRIGDNFATFESLADALRTNGLESCNLIVGIDMTQSNQSSGKHTYGGRSLHWIPPPAFDSEGPPKPFKIDDPDINPYRKCVRFVGEALSHMDEDGMIPAFYFGDLQTKAVAVQTFTPGNTQGCQGFQELLIRYESITPTLTMSGPTSFEPIINAAIEIVVKKRDFHILLIVADGQVSNIARDSAAIVRASNYPLSIVIIGVGDGPWDVMKTFDDHLRGRRFDNFQFVPFEEVKQRALASPYPSTQFALHCLMEVPDQYKIIKRLQYI